MAQSVPCATILTTTQRILMWSDTSSARTRGESCWSPPTTPSCSTRRPNGLEVLTHVAQLVRAGGGPGSNVEPQCGALLRRSTDARARGESRGTRPTCRALRAASRPTHAPRPGVGASGGTGNPGIRLPITRLVCKIKMSQDKAPVTQRQVMAALRAPGPFHNPGLADDMARALSRD